MTITSKLRSELSQLDQTLSKVQSRQNDFLEKNQYEQAQNLNTQISQLNNQINEKNTELNAEYTSPSSTIKVSDNNIVGPDQSSLKSLQRYQSGTILGDTSPPDVQISTRNSGFSSTTPQGSIRAGTNSIERGLSTLATAVPLAVAGVKALKSFVSKTRNRSPAAINTLSPFTGAKSKDLRVKIIVPNDYARASISADPRGYLGNFNSIIFPYTPTITFEQGARYTEQSPVHSNYPLFFYKNSYLGAISITGKFTVQNEKDAWNFLATLQLLRAITKMRWGDDSNAGAPPPVCRLEAYGIFMLEKLPIAVSSFRYEVADTVDYITVGPNTLTETFVPTLSTISLTCVPMFSKNELKYASTEQLLDSYYTERNKGYI